MNDLNDTSGERGGGSLKRVVRPPDCYVGRLTCGCLVAWVYDNGKHPKEVAESVAEFIRNGYAVERANTDDVRSQLGPCKHKRPNTVLDRTPAQPKNT